MGHRSNPNSLRFNLTKIWDLTSPSKFSYKNDFFFKYFIILVCLNFFYPISLKYIKKKFAKRLLGPIKRFIYLKYNKNPRYIQQTNKLKSRFFEFNLKKRNRNYKQRLQLFIFNIKLLINLYIYFNQRIFKLNLKLLKKKLILNLKMLKLQKLFTIRTQTFKGLHSKIQSLFLFKHKTKYANLKKKTIIFYFS